jgi:glycosyltransferase involved in cell wall biosynthesis
MVMIEAMGHALPVAAFDCPTGPADVLTHDVDGLLVPPGDVAALREALELLLGDAELRRRLGAAARERVRERFAWEAVIDATLRVYEDAV